MVLIAIPAAGPMGKEVVETGGIPVFGSAAADTADDFFLYLVVVMVPAILVLGSVVLVVVVAMAMVDLLEVIVVVVVATDIGFVVVSYRTSAMFVVDVVMAAELICTEFICSFPECSVDEVIPVLVTDPAGAACVEEPVALGGREAAD